MRTFSLDEVSIVLRRHWASLRIRRSNFVWSIELASNVLMGTLSHFT